MQAQCYDNIFAAFSSRREVEKQYLGLQTNIRDRSRTDCSSSTFKLRVKRTQLAIIIVIFNSQNIAAIHARGHDSNFFRINTFKEKKHKTVQEIIS